MAIDGLTIDGTDCTELGLKPPLVSVVLLNRNYAPYVGAAIDSIQHQDYSNFECLIIDNGSTDDSLAIITRHIDGDARFTTLFLDKNIGIMGAWLGALDRVKGEFITFLDSDDVKFPNFISSHVQVHLALRLGIGFTSSRVVEIDADGRVINSSNLGFGFNPFDKEPRGLKPRKTVPRLTSISDADYDTLDEWTTWIGPEKAGWYWAPTSANMYRRSVMNLARPDREERVNFIAGDIHFGVLCHILGSSAVINRTLSAYRIHRDNVHNILPSMSQMRTARKEQAEASTRQRQFILRVLLGRADSFSWIIKDRYWGAIDQQSGEYGDMLAAYYADPEIQQIFADYLNQLIGAFGIEVVKTELGGRFPSAESRYAILRALLARAPSFDPLLKADGYWELIDWCAAAGENVAAYFARPEVVALLLQNYDCLVESFGELQVLRELRRRYRIMAWCALIWRKRRWRLPKAAFKVVRSELVDSVKRFLSRL